MVSDPARCLKYDEISLPVISYIAVVCHRTMDRILTGKRILVVGASRGIGRGVATRFAEEGANVALSARSTDELEDAAADIDGRAVTSYCDLRDRESIAETVDTTVDAFGGIDATFNSAGVVRRGPVEDATEEDIELIIDVNLTGAIRLSKSVLPELSRTQGTLIHVSSEAGRRGVPELPVYCASKGGLNMLVKQLALDYGDQNVRIVGIAPGTTKTSLNEKVRREDPEWVEKRRSGIPLGRLGTITDISNLATFLVSDQADHIHGEIIGVDGGSTA